MRKMFCLLITMLLLVSIAQADEIMFRGIPWGSSIDEVKDALAAMGSSFVYKDTNMLSWDACKPYGYDFFEYPTGHKLSLIPATEDFKVAGYSVENITVYCAYGLEDGVQKKSKDSNFYLASYIFDVVDVRAAYNDLKKKLNQLYGDGEIATGNATMVWAMYKQEAVEWHGDNETGILLNVVTTNEGSDFNMDSLMLFYGKTNSKEMLNTICDTIRQELIGEERHSKTNSIDGL